MIPKLPLGQLGEQLINFINDYFQIPISVFSFCVLSIHGAIFNTLLFVPPWLLIAITCFAAWRIVGWRLAAFGAVSLLLLWNQGLWGSAIQTLSLVLTAAALSLVVAVPVGIILAEFPMAQRLIRPVLDMLQTMPRFVYLIPASVLFGLDVVPSVFATMTLAIVPPIRIIAVGIQQVDAHAVEAAKAIGASPLQVLCKVKLPLALPALGLAVSQCLLLSLAMSVIAALIGAGGLGADVLNAIALLDAGSGVVSGMGILTLAILIDRVSTALIDGGSRKRPATGNGDPA